MENRMTISQAAMQLLPARLADAKAWAARLAAEGNDEWAAEMAYRYEYLRTIKFWLEDRLAAAGLAPAE
jgi:hypothetical protein